MTKKVCRLHTVMAFFTQFSLVTLCQFHSNTSPLLFVTSLRNYRMREKKIFCIYGSFNVSHYYKVGKKSHHDTQLNF